MKISAPEFEHEDIEPTKAFGAKEVVSGFPKLQATLTAAIFHFNELVDSSQAEGFGIEDIPIHIHEILVLGSCILAFCALTALIWQVIQNHYNQIEEAENANITHSSQTVRTARVLPHKFEQEPDDVVERRRQRWIEEQQQAWQEKRVEDPVHIFRQFINSLGDL